ncbi:MAG: Trehalose utilization protein ThuA, partial [uncultured Arthrobacter sp.]
AAQHHPAPADHRLERGHPRGHRAGGRRHLPERHPRRHRRRPPARPRRGPCDPDGRPGRSRPRAQRGGPRGNRRPPVVGPHRPRPGVRRGGGAGPAARPGRDGPARAAFGPLLQDLHPPDGHHLLPAVAQRGGAGTRLECEPHPPHHGGDRGSAGDRETGNLRGVLRHPHPGRPGVHQLLQRRRGLPLGSDLHPGARTHLLLQPRRPGVSRLPPSPDPAGPGQRRPLGGADHGRPDTAGGHQPGPRLVPGPPGL